MSERKKIGFNMAVSDVEPGTMVFTMTNTETGLTLWSKQSGEELDHHVMEFLRLYAIALADRAAAEPRLSPTFESLCRTLPQQLKGH